jgi:hypothetical protein
MNTRERFHAIMNFEQFDRLPIIEWAQWWDLTIERWHKEELPKDITDRYDICKFFGLDIYKQDWISPYMKGCPQPAEHGGSIIKTEEDYDAVKKYLFPKNAINKEMWSKWAEEQKNGDIVIWFTIEGFFWFPRVLLGIEQHLYAFYEQPELMHRINEDLAEWMLQVTDQICEICTPDFMTFAEDMSYNHGSMISKKCFDKFLKPYYLKVVPALKEKGIIPIIDSDGDIEIPAKWFESVGLEGILPLERQAGVDLAQLRSNHPKMKFIGHFDKMTMHHGEEAMRKEFDRLLPTAAKGGFLVGCDHQTPPEVSMKNYKLYLKLFREYAEIAGKMSK